MDEESKSMIQDCNGNGFVGKYGSSGSSSGNGAAGYVAVSSCTHEFAPGAGDPICIKCGSNLRGGGC